MGGVPTVVGMAASVVLVFILNKILLHVGGSEAVAAYSLLMTIGNASNCIFTGVGGVSLKAPSFLLLRHDFGVQKENLLEMDIHSIDEVVSAAEQAQAFCRGHGQGEKNANHIALCVAEMASNTVLHGFEKDKNNHLSIRIQHKGNRWVLRFRDDCRAFDPVRYVPAGDQDALGLRLVTAMADDIRYTYSLSLNNLTIKLTAK